jgi:L-fuconolactonase
VKRIDAHHHLWRYTTEEYGWIDDRMSVLRRNFLVPDLKLETEQAGVSGTVAVQARQTVEETECLLQFAEAEPLIVGVVGWLPIASEKFPALLEQFAARPKLKGLRHIVQAEPAGFLDGEAFNRGIAQMHGTGLVYDILIFARQLAESIQFVDRHPEQAFVLDHVAKPSIAAGEIEAWAEEIRELAKRPNVSCKVSGMVTEADYDRWTPEQLEPYFDVVLDAFGPDRLMVGSDWPVIVVACSYERWWKIVAGWIARLSEAEQAAILGGTATRIYSL